MVRRKGCLIGCLSLAILVIVVVLSAGATGRLVDLHQIVESDGHRQVEYKIFGVIPYEKQEDSPETQVSNEFWREMRKTGIVMGPEMDRDAKGTYITRSLRPNEVRYWMYKTITGDHGALVAKYAAQVPKPPPYSPDWIYPRMSAGATRLSMTISLQAKGAKRGQDSIYFGIGVSIPKKAPTPPK